MPHGMAHTHLDSLAHISDNGVLYNGYTPDREALLRDGPARNSIHNVKAGIFTRGVLVDIAALKGVPYLEPGTPIFVEDLEAWERRAGVTISAGDALILRTGVWARRQAQGPWLRGRTAEGRAAGLHPSVLPWLKARDIAILASDSSSYVSPSNIPGAVHDFALIYLGVHVIDNCDLEALSAAAASRRRWTFLFTTAPLAVPRGTGTPINPIATF
jgi:kynurenine formamidase